jgi:hypothetical protein
MPNAKSIKKIGTFDGRQIELIADPQIWDLSRSHVPKHENKVDAQLCIQKIWWKKNGSSWRTWARNSGLSECDRLAVNHFCRYCCDTTEYYAMIQLMSIATYTLDRYHIYII